MYTMHIIDSFTYVIRPLLVRKTAFLKPCRTSFSLLWYE